ncbi:MAG: hypothetical protein AB1898_12090 [Acidobacteriota bacterium]
MTSILLLTSLLLWPAGLTFKELYSVPEWVRRVVEHPDFAKRYELDAHLNPFCHRADFDGDGKVDFVVFIRERSSGKIGVAFVHRAGPRFHVVGAGKAGVHGDDYSWVDAWAVFDKGAVSQGAEEKPPPRLKGDALLLFKTEAASALLWWNGSGYRWYQQGD